jgi:prefoldin subunit 5
MNEEEFKSAMQNVLMMQNNNDYNFQILQAQIDNLQRQLNELNTKTRKSEQRSIYPS